MEPMINIALRAARKVGENIVRASDDLDRFDRYIPMRPMPPRLHSPNLINNVHTFHNFCENTVAVTGRILCRMV